ncbi:hypothetical protein ACCO45_008527 [Purpureocillium lilacinum]|uniref:Uncharacterized protein n=1 Tax=Purpureocillium lilacinum TaxID=33203 RepID=A0ACC4DNT1_PURLI
MGISCHEPLPSHGGHQLGTLACGLVGRGRRGTWTSQPHVRQRATQPHGHGTVAGADDLGLLGLGKADRAPSRAPHRTAPHRNPHPHRSAAAMAFLR